jgi:phosphorylcholine metabolism protein LicD
MGINTSVLKVFVSWFKPVFRWLMLHYQRMVVPIIEKNKQIPDKDCFVGHGFNTPWIRKMKIDEIFPLREIMFEGQLFYAPNNTDTYLKYIYGSTYMTPPPKEQQVPPHGVIIKPVL